MLSLARDDPELDETRVVLVGFSLGGALAVHAAVADRRIAAVVTVTAPYDAGRWLHLASPVMVDHLVATAGTPEALVVLRDQFALPGVIEALECPLLVLGGGADLVMPPAESLRIAAAAGANATLVWYPDEGHGLYDAVDRWTDEVGRWINRVLDAESTQVDRDWVPVDELSQPDTGPVQSPAAPGTAGPSSS